MGFISGLSGVLCENFDPQHPTLAIFNSQADHGHLTHMVLCTQHRRTPLFADRIYFSVQFHNKPLLAWDVPLHLSYRKIGTVSHSRSLARYDPSLWNHAVKQVGLYRISSALTVGQYAAEIGNSGARKAVCGLNCCRPNCAVLGESHPCAVATLRGLRGNTTTLQNADVWFQLPLLPLLLRQSRASRVSRVSQQRRVLTPGSPCSPLLTLLTLVGG